MGQLDMCTEMLNPPSECIIWWYTALPPPGLLPLVAITTSCPQHSYMYFPQFVSPLDDESPLNPSIFLPSAPNSHSRIESLSEPPHFTASPFPTPPLLPLSVPLPPLPTAVGPFYDSFTGPPSGCYFMQLCEPGTWKRLWNPLDPSSKLWSS